MKKIFVVIMIVLSLSLMAKTEKFNVSGNEIELEFENIKVKDIKFHNGDELVVKYSENDVQIENDEKMFSFTSEFSAKISLKLPKETTYIIKHDDGIVKFTENSFVINGNEGEIITFESGGLNILGTDNEKVLITDDGIIVEDEDEFVSINKDGIIVQNEEEDSHFTGFWGKLAGSVIRSVAKASISYASKRPEKIAKWMINENNGYNSNIAINWSDNSLEDTGEDMTKSILKTFKMKDGEKVILNNINGGIEVSTWDKNIAQCEIFMKTRYGEKEFEKIEIRFDDTNHLLVETVKLEQKARVSVMYDIKIPRSAVLDEVETSNGHVNVDEAIIDGDLKTMNGAVKVMDCQGDIEINTSNGEIYVDNHQGSVIANTSNGKITALNISETVELYTNNGRVIVRNSPNIESIVTSNAKVDLTFKKLNKDLKVKTSNGSIKMTVSPDMAFDIEATTTNGGINVEDLSLDLIKNTSSYLKANLNKGGRLITLSTSNSRINIVGDKELY